MPKRNITKQKVEKSKRTKKDNHEATVKENTSDVKESELTSNQENLKDNDVTKHSNDKDEKTEAPKEIHVKEDAEKGDIESKNEDVNDNIDYSKDWINGESYLIYNPSELESSSKIAAFDVDGTLIETKSGKIFPKTWDDFKILYDEIPGKLQSLKTEGYKLVIVTNQDGIRTGKVDENEFKKKMISLLKQLGVFMQIFVATDMSALYRKPNTGFFDLLRDKYNSDVKVDLSNSMYVGDAAGRLDNWAPGRKKDFSCSDRLFALNCGLKFHTPEEYFLGEPPALFVLPTLCPSTVVTASKLTIVYGNPPKTTHVLVDVLPPSETDTTLIILIGTPCSGKSHFYETHLRPLGYAVVTGSAMRSLTEVETALKAGKKVVLDGRNADKTVRKKCVAAAHKAGAKHVLYFVFKIDTDQCLHNSKFRELTDPSAKVLSARSITTPGKQQSPTLAEKCTAICTVTDTGFAFDSDEKKTVFSRYLNDA